MTNELQLFTSYYYFSAELFDYIYVYTSPRNGIYDVNQRKLAWVLPKSYQSIKKLSPYWLDQKFRGRRAIRPGQPQGKPRSSGPKKDNVLSGWLLNLLGSNSSMWATDKPQVSWILALSCGLLTSELNHQRFFMWAESLTPSCINLSIKHRNNKETLKGSYGIWLARHCLAWPIKFQRYKEFDSDFNSLKTAGVHSTLWNMVDRNSFSLFLCPWSFLNF